LPLSSAASADNTDGNESSVVDEDFSAASKHAKVGGNTVRDNLEQEVENAERAAARYTAVDVDSDDDDDAVTATGSGKPGKKNRLLPTHQDMVNLCDSLTDKLAATKDRTDQLMELGHQIIESHKKSSTI